MRSLYSSIVGLVAVCLTSLVVLAQSPTPAPRRPRPRATVTRIVSRDRSGSPLAGAHVTVSGPAMVEATTDDTGTASIAALKDGAYRLRFEREGFITLERDVTIRSGQPAQIEAALSFAPSPPAPSPTPAPTPAPGPAVGPGGPPVTVSIPAFLDKNFIGRDPLKESVLGCAPDAMARLLQLRDPLAVHTHSTFDEVLYVVAGEGAVKIRDEEKPLVAGTLSIIPRGVPHGLERRGNNPLVMLSMLTGGACKQ